MFELFVNPPDINVGAVKPPEWPFIKSGFQRNIKKVMDYHRTFPRGVKNNHFLIRLLHSITTPKSLELERYFTLVDSIALNVSMSLKMTSVIYKGAFHKGIFYGENSLEILIACDDYFDFEEAHRDWRNVAAVKPLLHPKSDMDIRLPYESSYTGESGLSVILINVTMLAVQYRAFCMAQRHLPEGSVPKTIAQFIGGYVVPNMLPAQMDICLFNRIHNKFYKYENKRPPFIGHSFTLSNYTPHIDIVIDKVLGNIDRCSKRFDVALKQIPSFYNDDIYKSLLVPDLAPTMQVSWAMVMSRIRIVSFLFDICRENLTNRNGAYISQILRAFRSSSVYYVLQSSLPDNYYFEFHGYVDNILDALDRNTF